MAGVIFFFKLENKSTDGHLVEPSHPKTHCALKTSLKNVILCFAETTLVCVGNNNKKKYVKDVISRLKSCMSWKHLTNLVVFCT